MDIAALSIGMKQIQLQQAAGISVLKLALDARQESAKMMTEALAGSAKVMEQSVNPNLGANLDMLI